MTGSDKLKILVIDESVVYRHLLSEVVGAMPQVGSATASSSGRIALSKLQLQHYDLILLDLEMRQEDSLRVLRAIRQAHPEQGVAIVSGRGPDQAVQAVKALELGALDILTRPSEKGEPASVAQFRSELELVLRVMSGRRNVHLARRLTGSGAPAPAAGPAAPPAGLEPIPPAISRVSLRPPTRPLPASIQAVVIGVSTGGPKALQEVLPRLPGDLPVPVFLVQHMPRDFTRALAESLGQKSRLQVKEGQQSEMVRPGIIYLAPGGRHMVVQRGSEASQGQVFIRLTNDPPVNSCRPAVDVLLESMPRAYGGKALVVIMTGMGNDGRMGVEAIKRHGAYCLTQSEETCVVYGMPRAVDEAGLSDESIPLGELAGRIVALVSQAGRGRSGT